MPKWLAETMNEKAKRRLRWFIPFVYIFFILIFFLEYYRSHQYEKFNIIILPDTQKYTKKFPWFFTSQTKWIAENRERLNILFVFHEGDPFALDRTGDDGGGVFQLSSGRRLYDSPGGTPQSDRTWTPW